MVLKVLKALEGLHCPVLCESQQIFYFFDWVEITVLVSILVQGQGIPGLHMVNTQ